MQLFVMFQFNTNVTKNNCMPNFDVLCQKNVCFVAIPPYLDISKSMFTARRHLIELFMRKNQSNNMEVNNNAKLNNCKLMSNNIDLLE